MKNGKIKKILKRTIVILLMFVIVFYGYVEMVNLNSKNMTYRQKVLKAVYPALMWWGKLTGKNTTELSNIKKQPVVSFYSLRSVLNDGIEFDFSTLKGKKILLVNTASNCGYTNQYNDLEKLYEQNKNELIVIGFPANDFKEQEKGTDEEIAQFCKENYNITFPLMKKSVVIKSDQQNEVFKWLTDSTKNGWNNKQPAWNFCKYLVDENGILINYFGTTISPMSKDVLDAIHKTN